MSRSPRTRCDSCDATMPMAVRVEGGYAYCRKCYQVTFEPAVCTRCKGKMRAHYNDLRPVCRDCQRNGRRCLRCDGKMKKAGRLLNGRSLCPSCAPHFGVPRTCPSCGETARKMSKAPGSDLLVCERCRKADYVTCATCRRHRRKAGVGTDGRPVCKHCLPGAEVTHECPDCGREAPGGGSAPCQKCALKRRVRRRIELNVELLEQDWCRDLFFAFCAWLELRREDGNLTRRIDQYARFFEQLDKFFSRPDAISQVELIQAFGADALRRKLMVIRFLIERAGLRWDSELTVRKTLDARNIKRLENCHEEPWYPLLESYFAFLTEDPSPDDPSRRMLSPRTIGTYLNAAIRLLRAEQVSRASDLRQDAARRLVRRYPGYAASVTPFISYLKEEMSVIIDQPPTKSSNRRKHEKALASEIRALHFGLVQAAGRPRARALIARLISKMYQLPLEAVLALRWSQVDVSERGIRIRINSECIILLADTVAEFFHRWMLPRGAVGYVFPGRIPVCPLSTSAVIFHVREVCP